jgi:hypothetical protein
MAVNPYPTDNLVYDAFDETHGRLVRRRVFATQDAALLSALASWPSLKTVLAVENIRSESSENHLGLKEKTAWNNNY